MRGGARAERHGCEEEKIRESEREKGRKQVDICLKGLELCLAAPSLAPLNANVQFTSNGVLAPLCLALRCLDFKLKLLEIYL